ncbi:diguanylate cyclase [Musicola keenii]|uniref:diguanylate cyclase n=1 Tax=Musicola keenii TaxID=2884250 RepID=UPI0038B2F49E
MFLMRQLGTFLCFFPIASVLYELSRSWPLFLLLVLNAFVWPHIAYAVSSHARDPVKAEFINMTLDTAFGGAWVALMGVCPLPSAIIISILIADRYAAGGWKLLRMSTVASFVSFILVWTLLRFEHYTILSERTLWLTLPLSTIYMITLSVVSYQLAARLREKSRELERITLMDPYLSIPNRRLFEQRLDKEFLRTQRGESHAYLMLIDVDHFKYVNDSYGHEAGDYLLTEISVVLRTIAGKYDVPARFGGDELGIIIQNSTDKIVTMTAHQLHAKVATIRLPADPSFCCTISIGIARAEHAATPQSWLNNADQALYAAKKSGKNRFHMMEHESAA